MTFLLVLIRLLCRITMAGGDENTDDMLKLTEEELMDTGEQAREEDILQKAGGLLNSPSSRQEIPNKLPFSDKFRTGSVTALVSGLDIGTGTDTGTENVNGGTGTAALDTSSGTPSATNTNLKPNGSEPPSCIQSIQVPKSSTQSTDPGFESKSIIGTKLVPEKSGSSRLGPDLVPVPMQVPVPVPVPVPVTVLAPVTGLLVVGVFRLST
jgi:hypothetical protein